MTNPSSSAGDCRGRHRPQLWRRVCSTNETHYEAAKYQDNPKDGQQCSGCVQFVAPASCKVVEDPVAASGWCQLFTAKPA